MEGMVSTCAHHPAADLELHAVPYGHRDAQALVRALYDEQLRCYHTADPPEADPDDYSPPTGLFLVGYAEGQPVACGGYRPYEPTTVEIKKMYVRPRLRGRGYGRAVLEALERAAAQAGAERVILETGEHNSEAIGLYTHAGYKRISGYSIYGHSPRNRAFGRTLAAQ